MELRCGMPSDIPFIYRLEKLYIEEIENDQLARWQDSIERHLKQWVNSLPHTTIAHLRDIPIGYLFWEREGEKAVIASVNVDPSFRRRGVGSALLRSFEGEARLAGCSVAELGFVIHNPARHLYERCGYQTAGVKGRYLLMIKHL
ncbi:GNAT family N-acetyltransferase [Bradyrhizobium sp. INPA03-11B]|uniref:GNAT family N-acetyltransferase n=1 Tax=Bradyrhizobium sp. INPA03-11B TaxID=418598 RepID=UPI00338D897B